jgi:hypothetical protein
MGGLPILVLYLIHQATDYSIKENPIRDYTPKTLRLMLSVNKIPTSIVNRKTKTIIVGTSHVLLGFDSCANNSIKLIAQNAMTAKTSINTAESLIYDINDLNLILEVSLIESQLPLSKTTTVIFQYAHSGAQGLLNLAANVFHLHNDSCNAPENEVNENTNQLDKSRALTNNLDQTEVSKLFSQYQRLLNNLVSICDDSVNNPRITLVSFPIQPSLFASPKIQTAFQQLEINMQNYLKTIHEKHSCNIRYINLTSLGAEFPEKKYWSDPGHFRPEIGKRVIEKIELSYANKN